MLSKPLAIVAATALQLSLVSIADAHPYRNDLGMQSRAPALGPKTLDLTNNHYMGRQSAMRAGHPITRGGTVNPSLTRDHMQHGDNV
jgi:hypothetical protein